MSWSKREVGLGRDRARFGGADLRGSAAQVEHGDLVAETVHLEEAAVREGAHGRYMAQAPKKREFATSLSQSRGLGQRPLCWPAKGRSADSPAGQAACVFPSVFFSSRSLCHAGACAGPEPAGGPAFANSALSGLPTLVPNPGDPVNVDEVALKGKPAAILSGTSTWDDGFTNLKNAFRKIEEELTRVGDFPRRVGR